MSLVVFVQKLDHLLGEGICLGKFSGEEIGYHDLYGTFQHCYLMSNLAVSR